MQNSVYEEVAALIADYIDVAKDQFSMDVDLDIEYDMDSTEMTELAKKIEEKFAIAVVKSDRQDWVSGLDIYKFVEKNLTAGM